MCREANQVTFEQRTDEDASIREVGIDSQLGIKIFAKCQKRHPGGSGFRCKWRIATNEGIAKRYLADDDALLFRLLRLIAYLKSYCLPPVIERQTGRTAKLSHSVG